jgi:hypothetical protein
MIPAPLSRRSGLTAKREGKIHNPAQDTKKQGALGATSNQSSRGLPYGMHP